MCKNLKKLAAECLKMEITTCTGNFFSAKQHFLKWIPAPENCKNQETNRIKSKKFTRTLKLCTLATNNLYYADLQLTLYCGSIDC